MLNRRRDDCRTVRYEARASVMFGAYAVWAAYADGTGEAVAHGTPMHCLRLAERLNRELGSAPEDRAGDAPPSADDAAGKPLFEGEFGSFPAFDRLALAELIRRVARENCRMAEIGSWLGTGSTQVFLRELAACPGSELICVDHWQGSNNVARHQDIVAKYDVFGSFLRNVYRSGCSTKVTPIRQCSAEAAAAIADGMLDLVFIDADHGYRAIRDDIAAWRAKVRVGGILCGHDCEMRVDAASRARLDAARDDDACEIPGLPFAHVHAGV